jgi:hypothetical protein
MGWLPEYSRGIQAVSSELLADSFQQLNILDVSLRLPAKSQERPNVVLLMANG